MKYLRILLIFVPLAIIAELWLQDFAWGTQAVFIASALGLIPLAGGLRVSLTMREDERAQLMADNSLAGMHQQIWTARKYSEGYALVFEIRGDKEFKPFVAFLKKLIALRG